MSEKKKRIRGFAGVIASQLEPVNNKKRFKEKFKDYEDFRLVINASDARYAAIVIIDKGVLSVEGVRNSDKAVIKKLKKESEGYLEMTIDLFFKMAMGELSTAAQAKYWLTRKIKVKGMKNVNILNKLFYYLTDEVK